VWAVLVAAYLAQGWRQVAADARDPVLAPFVAIPGICAMLLGAALAGPAPGAGRVVVAVFLAVTVALGGWMTGRWMTGVLDRDRVHPGYFLPTVAGGLVGAFAAAEVHLRAVAEASFGIGVLCWILLGSVLLNRLFYVPALPAALQPTMAIELAPPAVAGIAYFALTGGAVNPVSLALAGYAVLMALVQLSLLPAYLRLRFTPGFWAFTFSFAAAATDALLWIRRAGPPGAAGYAIAILAAITVLLAAITARTIVALARGQFLPSRAPAPPRPAGRPQTEPAPGQASVTVQAGPGAPDGWAARSS
jgi:tellurite resistance protein